MGLRRKRKGRGDKRSSKRLPKPPNAVDTLISEHAEVLGDVHFAGGLHLDGHIKGNVIADTDANAILSVGESARVEGDVRVPHVVLNGSIDGDVHACERIALSACARVDGSVSYNLIEMASGALVNGHLIYEGDSEEALTASSLDETTVDENDDTRGQAFNVGATET